MWITNCVLLCLSRHSQIRFQLKMSPILYSFLIVKMSVDVFTLHRTPLLHYVEFYSSNRDDFFVSIILFSLQSLLHKNCAVMQSSWKFSSSFS